MKAKIHLPFYHKPPNKFVRYEMRSFPNSEFPRDERVAHYTDKDGKHKEMTAQVIWI